MMKSYFTPLSIPKNAIGFEQDVWSAATAIVERSGVGAPLVAELRASDDFMDTEDVKYFMEVAAACRHILILNQMPPLAADKWAGTVPLGTVPGYPQAANFLST